MIAEKIRAYLDGKRETFSDSVEQLLLEEGTMLFHESLKRLLFSEDRDSKGKLYMSAGGACARKTAYSYHGFEPKGRKIDSRSRFNFFMGDMVELAIVLLASKAGVDIRKFGTDQMRAILEVQGGEVSGRPDGLIANGHEVMLLEVKSMSTFGFRLFESKGEISYEYLAQVNNYMEALNVSRCVFIGVCKDTGVYKEKIVEKDHDIILANKLNCISVLQSTPEKLPPPDSRFNFNPVTREYPWQCCYCSYWKTCRTNAEYVLVKKSNKLVEKPKELV